MGLHLLLYIQMWSIIIGISVVLVMPFTFSLSFSFSKDMIYF